MQKKEYEDDVLMLGGHPFHSRFILGSGKFSLSLIQTVMEYGGSEIATIALRRANADSKENILDFLPKNITLLPNTSGDFVKVEIIHETKYLLPDNEETIRATRQLAKEGFIVLPYMYPDLVAARKLEDAGAAAIMPLGAPIGSNQGLRTKDFIRILIDEMKLPIIVDAGIGAPSQACEAMEMGAAAVMANTAVATAGDCAAMATAFRLAIEAGRLAYLSKLGRVLDKGAEASSPLTGFLQD